MEINGNQWKSRKYYLHKMCKRFTKVKATSREIEVTEPLLESITAKQREYLKELADKFGYNVQYIIQ